MDDPRIELGDPTTSPQRLFEIAHTHPEFGMLIAAHPNAYPELRQWVAAVAAQQVQRASSLSEAAAPASVSEAAAAAANQTAQAAGAVSSAAVAATSAVWSAATPAATEAHAKAKAASRSFVGFVAAHKTLTILVASSLVVLLAAGGGVAWYLVSRLGGASSPTAAVQKLVSAVQGKDLLSLYGSLAPSEIGELQPSIEKMANDSTSKGGASTNSAMSALQKAVTITPSAMSFDTTQLAPGVDRVVWSGGSITISGDRNQVADALYSFIEPILRSEAKASGLSSSAIDTDVKRSREQFRQGIALPLVIHPAGERSIPIEAVTVQENGGWFVSPLMTLADMEYRAALASSSRSARPIAPLGDVIVSAQHYSSPDAAAAALASAIADGDSTSAAAALSLPERRLMSVYGPWIQSGYSSNNSALGKLTLTDDRFQSTISGSTASVRIEHLAYTDSRYDNDVQQNLTTTVTLTGTCASWSSQFVNDNGNEEYNPDTGLYDWVPSYQVQTESGNGCLNSVPVMDRLGAGDFTISAVQENGGWLISPIATAANALGIVVDHYLRAEKTGTLDQIFAQR